MDALHLEANVNPMHDAGRENDVAALRDLLATHDVDEEDQYTLTALHWACDTGSNDVAAVLLAAGADANRVERRRFKRRPVHFAALNGSTCLLELLRNVGNADMHAIDGMGRTPLHCASHGGSVDAVAWLLDVAGSDASAVTFDGHTALDLAVLNHQPAVVKFLEARRIHFKLLPASDKTRSRATLHG
ncbi:hypothetical protein H310_04434 [Aphanomyces invadans]|uniref:Uncharacterized protein n=1 Tax=Aphanomyces invadans TaxID=157072 RepID=A0A024UCB0_9STRA|nr:hypothetical protein H310_04434 [Aphanomyces invadans]ETW04051.1 hypothetical protein H310_04434 [Aphanomyces invadans]|eukprot:XP_008867007.1 hypothetical protein H310_04434 [Aphanomyces invadans]